MRYTLEVNIDDDALRASGMTPEKYLRRSLGSLQEYGIRIIASSEPNLTRHETKECLESCEDTVNPDKQKNTPELGH